MNKKKVLMITPTFYPNKGGAEKMIYELCEGLSKYYDIDLLTPDFGEIKPKITSFNVHQVCRPTKNRYLKFFKYQYFIYKKAKKLLKQNKYDLIHVHYIFPSMFSMVSLKSEFNLPLLVTEHHFGTGMDISSYNENPKIVNMMMKSIAKNVDYFVSTGKTQNEFLNYLGVDKTKVKTIYLGGDCVVSKENKDSILKKFDLNKSSKYVLSVSRIVYRKRYDLLIDAVKEITKTRKDIVFLIAGKGELLEELKIKVKKEGIEDNIKFLGFVTDKDLSKLRKISSAFVSCSEFEGAGIMYFEAFCSKLPMFVKDNIASKEAIIDKKTGFLFNSANELSNLIVNNIDNTKLLNKVSLEGYNQYKSRYNWSLHNKEYKKYYDEIIK